jgi:hypothetical protein
MPSVTQGIQSGYQIGRAFADPAPTEPSKMQSYVMKELIEGAYGVFRRKDGSVYVPQHFPKEARQLVIHKYIEKEKQASKEMFEEKKAKIEMVGKLQGVMEKVSEWGTDPKTKNFAISTYTQMIGEILGDKAQEMGVEKIADVATAAVTSQERKEAVDQKLYEILSGLFLRYNETGDIDYLNKYASLFAANPKKFKELGLSNPQTKIEDHFEKLEKSATEQEATKKELKVYEEKRKLDAKYRQQPKTPTVKPDDALKRVSAIREKIAKFENTGVLTTAMFALFDEKDQEAFAPLLNRKASDEEKRQLMDAWSDELEYLDQFVPEKYKKRRMTYVDGKLVEK